MESKYTRHILLGIALLSAVISCKNPPPAVQEKAPVDNTAAIARETASPDKSALDELDSVTVRAETARDQVLEIDSPGIYPRDWESADSLYDDAEKRRKTTTLRETQESTARYSVSAEALEVLSDKTEVLFAEGKEEELAHARAEAAKYLAQKKEAAEIAAREKERGKAGAVEIAAQERERQEREAAEIAARERERRERQAADTRDRERRERETAEIAAREKERQENAYQLQRLRETDDAIAVARNRLDFAALVKAPLRYPAEHDRAQTAYAEALSFRIAKRWDDAIAAANRVLTALAYIDREPVLAVPVQTAQNLLPAQYTVRSWKISGDSLRSIAGLPWVYDDPGKWRILYETNKSRMPDPDNPDLIEIGMIIIIPSIRGELRQGMWDENKSYANINE